jgi:hypothetical protein
MFARFAKVWLQRAIVSCLATASVSAQNAAHAGEATARTGYFQTLDGSVGFVFDRSGETPKQRFDGSPEILLLVPAPAARGDTVYRQSDGLIVLRETPFGALTLFTRQYRNGTPVVRIDNGSPIAQSQRNAATVAADAVALTERLKVGLDSPVSVEIPATVSLSVAALAVLDDAIENTGLAFDRVLSLPSHKAALAGLVKKVYYRVGARPAGAMRKNVLNLDVTPPLGLAGRLSSAEIEEVLTGAIAIANSHDGTAGTAASSFDRNNN